MNVLLLSFDYALLARGALASETRRRQLRYAQELRRRAPGSHLFIIVRSAPGMSMQPVTVSDGLSLYPTAPSTMGFIYRAYRYGCELCALYGIDLIASQSPFSDGLVALILRSRCKAKWLAQLHMSSLDNPYWLAESRVNHLRAWLGKAMLRRADAVRVVSRGAAAWLQQKVGIAQEDIFVIPVGTVLATEATEGSVKHAVGQSILFVGHLTVAKGVFTLLHAFHRVKECCDNATLVIVGDGPERPSLEELASMLGLQEKVRFAGMVPYEQLPRFYAEADVFVLPSLHESYGRVIVEAMSFGRTVVATDTEGARDLIKDGETGFIVPVGDVQALADRISYLLCNPQVARRMGEAARQFVKRTQNPQDLCAAQVEMWLKVAGS